MSKSRKYHTSATDGGDTFPHYLSRCPDRYITNSPKQTGRKFDLYHNTDTTVKFSTANTMFTVYIHPPKCQLLSPSANMSLSFQTCWVLLIPPTHTPCVGVGVLFNSSRQLDSITPTRESFVRDGFKVGFSTLYFPRSCMLTLPKHLFQLSRCGPKRLGPQLVKEEDNAKEWKGWEIQTINHSRQSNSSDFPQLN